MLSFGGAVELVERSEQLADQVTLMEQRILFRDE